MLLVCGCGCDGWEFWVVVWAGKGEGQSIVTSPWVHHEAAMMATF